MRSSARTAAPLIGTAVVEAVMRYTDQVPGEIDSFASGEEGSDRLEKISLYLYGPIGRPHRRGKSRGDHNCTVCSAYRARSAYAREAVDLSTPSTRPICAKLRPSSSRIRRSCVSWSALSFDGRPIALPCARA